MQNKKIILSLLTLLSFNIHANTIIGVGQIGDKYVYKINDMIISLSAGDIVDGCIVRSGSGLQCDDSFDKSTNKASEVVMLENNIAKLQNLSKLSLINKKLKTDIKELKSKNSRYIKQINKKNKLINKFSKELNNRK